VSYRATLDLPVATARTVSRWIAAHRRRHDVRPWQRAATSWTQTIMLLRRLIQAPGVAGIARDAGVSPATAYRYLHEALNVVSGKAPELPDVLRGLKDKGVPFVCLDGTLVRTDRVAERDHDTGYHLWYSGKHEAPHAATSKWRPTTPATRCGASPVEPGSTHDIEAARAHVLPALYPAAADRMPTLADNGYVGAGIGVKTPIKGTKPDTGARSYNQVQASLRAPAERANALLKGFKALKRVTLNPPTITNITTTAPVILNLNNNLPR